MIRFACPRCKAVLEQPDQDGGAKIACSSCGQRLQVPEAPQAKTMLGNLVGGESRGSENRGGAGEAKIRTVNGRDHIYWYCPLCQNQVDVPLDLGQATVRCPHCTQKIGVPVATRGASPPPPPPGVLQPYVTAHPEHTLSSPAATAPPSWPGAEAPPPPLSRRSRRAADFDDDYDDMPIQQSGSGRYTREVAARASVTGMVCSLLGLGLLVVTLFLWVLGTRPGGNFRDGGAILLLMTFVSLGSFVMGLLGTIFSSRGLDVSNNHNRGMAVAGLVCGIIAMVVGAIFLFFFLMCGLVFSTFPH